MRLATLGGAALRLAPRGTGRLETADVLAVDVEGAACNAAVAAARLGAEAAWLSRLPDDPLGRRVASELRGQDVEVVARFGEGRQGLAFFERGSTPRADGRIDDRANAAVEALSFDALPSEPVETADVAYVAGETPAAATGLAESTAKFLKTAGEGGATTALGLLDPGGVADEAAQDAIAGLLPAVDVLVATAGAVEAVFGRSGEPTRIAHVLASNHGFETVALLRDVDAAAWHDSTVHELALPDVETVDVTGAVDAFAGAFLAGVVGSDVQTALRGAVAADALVRTTPRSLPVFTRAELETVAETLERP
jgi:2-dehydro-3-deoxygluconokinase